MFKYYVCTFLLFAFLFQAKSQSPRLQKIREQDILSQLDSLKKNFSHKKKISAEFELAFYAAITYYPELQHTRIKFKSKTLKSTMAARPSIWSMIRSKSKRKYIIFVNTKSGQGIPLYDEFTFNAKVGLIGHELAHVLHYTQTGFFKIAGEGMHYGKTSFRSQYERYTDSITIVRGLGWQVYDFSSQLHANPNVPDSYKLYKEEVYFSPMKILGIMSDLGYEF